MSIFWTTPRKVKTAKITVIVISILFLIPEIFGYVYGWKPPYTNDYMSLIGLLISICLDIFLAVIICWECKWLILIALVIFGVHLVLSAIIFNFAFIAISVSLMTTLKDQAKLRNETDAFFNALFIQAILVSLWTLLFIRYYALLTVYRWTKIPRITANVASSGPRITVHNI
ncbi:unnamed protein product [Caenorhabditis nigoni]